MIRVLFELTEMLDEAKIPYEVVPHSFIEDAEIVFYPSEENVVCDAICHPGSYGYPNALEIMGLLTEAEAQYDDVAGFLSPEEVFNRMSNHYKSQKND